MKKFIYTPLKKYFNTINIELSQNKNKQKNELLHNLTFRNLAEDKENIFDNEHCK